MSIQYVDGDEIKPYENKQMGIRFNYPASWEFGFAGIMPESCQYLSCSIELIRRDNASFGTEYGDSGGLRIMLVPINSAGCNCTGLDEYVKWKYNMLTGDKGFIFIDDNQTFVAGHPARVVNYNISFVGSFNYVFESSPYTVTGLFTKTDNAFYEFTFFGLGGYPVLQKDFDTVIKTVEFLPLQFNKPSFLN